MSPRSFTFPMCHLWRTDIRRNVTSRPVWDSSYLPKSCWHGRTHFIQVGSVERGVQRVKYCHPPWQHPACWSKAPAGEPAAIKATVIREQCPMTMSLFLSPTGDRCSRAGWILRSPLGEVSSALEQSQGHLSSICTYLEDANIS